MTAWPGMEENEGRIRFLRLFPSRIRFLRYKLLKAQTVDKLSISNCHQSRSKTIVQPQNQEDSLLNFRDVSNIGFYHLFNDNNDIII